MVQFLTQRAIVLLLLSKHMVAEMNMEQSSNDSAPIMKMYFHGGINDYMLLESWVPKTVGSYTGAWILFFLLGIVLEAFLVFGNNLQARWILERENSTEDYYETQPKQFGLFGLFELSNIITWNKAAILSILKLLESGLAYFLMLVTMIFNTGLFFSVVSGHAVGVFLFSRFRNKSVLNVNSDPEHEGLSTLNNLNPNEFVLSPNSESEQSEETFDHNVNTKLQSSCN